MGWLLEEEDIAFDTASDAMMLLKMKGTQEAQQFACPNQMLFQWFTSNSGQDKRN